ncbi:MAG: hypothetical protein A3E87_09315 [Gammaproteobacteria bacterium RIFCSPHIGHO2_12_FULL_35_23]|nr:MAG: hypothetical protein A3E87_09315 [Gammaproteobacteria bacterium RIFCSPHIGHO2_12_FULL_35_23]
MTRISSVRSTRTPWLVCLSAALFFYYVFFQLAMFNTISSHLMQTFNLNATSLGYLSSSYFFADALLIIPAGILLDRFSTRTIALSMMTACVISTYIFSVTHSYFLALLCRALTGAGNAFAFLTSMQLASRWLPPKRLALGIGLIITTIMLGGIVAQTPLALLTSAIGWRSAMVINATLGLFFLAFMYYQLQDYPLEYHHSATLTQNRTLFSNLKTALKSSQNWFCAGFVAFMNLPISLLGELWGVMYLTQTHHLSMTTATNITSMMFIGMIIGSPCMGWLSDKMQRRRIPMIMSAVFILAIVGLIAYINITSAILLGSLFFILGLLASAQVISYPTIAESNSLAITGTAMSTVAIFLNIVSFIAQPLFGWLIHLGWNGMKINNTPIYSAANFHLAMLLLPLAFIISLFIALKVKETYCRHKNQVSEPISELTLNELELISN